MGGTHASFYAGASCKLCHYLCHRLRSAYLRYYPDTLPGHLFANQFVQIDNRPLYRGDGFALIGANRFPAGSNYRYSRIAHRVESPSTGQASFEAIATLRMREIITLAIDIAPGMQPWQGSCHAGR